jgi:hypothetical protein
LSGSFWREAVFRNPLPASKPGGGEELLLVSAPLKVVALESNAAQAEWQAPCRIPVLISVRKFLAIENGKNSISDASQ